MSTGWMLLVVAAGFVIGTSSGMIGIGGGIMVIPLLTMAFGFSQERANGTSLAMLLPPVGILAVLTYARSGNVDWRYAGLLACGFTVGAAVGGALVNRGWVHPTALRILFAVLLLYVAGRTLFRPGGQARAALGTTVLMVGVTGTYAAAKLLGRRWEARTGRWAAVYRHQRSLPEVYDYEI